MPNGLVILMNQISYYNTRRIFSIVGYITAHVYFYKSKTLLTGEINITNAMSAGLEEFPVERRSMQKRFGSGITTFQCNISRLMLDDQKSEWSGGVLNKITTYAVL